MAGITNISRALWEKSFPPIQQRALRGMGSVFFSAYKKNTDSVTSSTALVADSELFLPMLPAGVPFGVTAYLITTCAAAGNVNIDLNNSTGVLGVMSIQTSFINAAGAVTAGALQTALNTGSNGGTTNVNIAVSMTGVIQLATPGQIGLRFAQQASSATATTTGPGSFIYLEALDVDQFT